MLTRRDSPLGAWPPASREGLAAASGVLLFLSFPKFGHGSVAFVALVPLLLALPGAAGWRALGLGWITGAIWSLGTLYWTAYVVVQYGGLSLPVGIAVMALLCLAVALFPALFAWTLARWIEAVGPPALLAAPVAWVATEILRAHTFFRFPWCLLGYSQHQHLPVLQLAALAAVYGVSFVVAGCSGGLAYLMLERRPVPRRRVLLTLGVLAAAVWGGGSWWLSRPLPEAPALRVGLVQASILQEDKWDPAQAVENVHRHLDLTLAAVDRGARLVVWPESSVPFYFDRSPDLAEQLRRLVQERRIYLLFGNDDRLDGPGGAYRVWVGAKMLAPSGDLALRYHKIRLVPFGEYVPMQPLLTLGGRLTAKLVREVADFTPGSRPSIGRVDGHALGAFICYEAIFPDLVRRFAIEGATLLVNITNDGWYGRTSAPHQHLAMARFRAVENGVYLVRAANTGITAVIDARGRLLEQTRLFERAALVREVPLVQGATFYRRHGDVFAWCCLASAALATLGTLGRRGC